MKFSTPFHDLNCPEIFCCHFHIPYCPFTAIIIWWDLWMVKESEDEVFVFEHSFTE